MEKQKLNPWTLALFIASVAFFCLSGYFNVISRDVNSAAWWVMLAGMFACLIIIYAAVKDKNLSYILRSAVAIVTAVVFFLL